MTAQNWIRDVADKVTNVVMNYSDTEAKVREATSDDPWGPSGSLMQEIARASYAYNTFPDVMGMLWCRIFHEGNKNWRRIYKTLLLLSYLLLHGSEHVVNNTRNRIRRLKKYECYVYIDENGKDEGLNVRKKVREILILVQDTERLRQERKRAKASRGKFVGLSNEDAGFGFHSRQVPHSMQKESFSFEPYHSEPSYKEKNADCFNNSSSTPASRNVAENKNDSDPCEVQTSQQKRFASEYSGTKIDLGAAKNYSGNHFVDATNTSSAYPDDLIGAFSDMDDVFKNTSRPAYGQASSLGRENDFGSFQSSAADDGSFFDLSHSKLSSDIHKEIPSSFSPNNSMLPPATSNQPTLMQNSTLNLTSANPASASNLMPGSYPNTMTQQPSVFYSSPPPFNPPTSLYDDAPQMSFDSSNRFMSVDSKVEENAAKTNTWSDTNGIDISLDSLKPKRNSIPSTVWNQKPDNNSMPLNTNTNQAGMQMMNSPTKMNTGLSEVDNGMMYGQTMMMNSMDNNMGSISNRPVVMPYNQGQFGNGFACRNY